MESVKKDVKETSSESLEPEPTATPMTSLSNISGGVSAQSHEFSCEGDIAGRDKVDVNIQQVFNLSHRQPQSGSGISRLQTQLTFGIPILGEIVCGPARLSFPDIVDQMLKHTRYGTPVDMYILTDSVVPDQDGLYALRVRGTSMIDAMINDGDTVIMKRQCSVKDGEIVAARLIDRDEMTLKYFYREPDRIRLQPANPLVEPIYTSATNVDIQGRVVAIIKRFN
jgi:SOS-response transcriptional repressor LexA